MASLDVVKEALEICGGFLQIVCGNIGCQHRSIMHAKTNSWDLFGRQLGLTTVPE